MRAKLVCNRGLGYGLRTVVWGPEKKLQGAVSIVPIYLLLSLASGTIGGTRGKAKAKERGKRRTKKQKLANLLVAHRWGGTDQIRCDPHECECSAFSAIHTRPHSDSLRSSRGIAAPLQPAHPPAIRSFLPSV